MFKKYRIRYDERGYYVIQKRRFFWVYTDMEHYVRSQGLDEVYATTLYSSPPTEKLAELLKYG
jgi:hypothetical protein